MDIRNDGDEVQDLAGWTLFSEKGNQASILGGAIAPGETLRVWAVAQDLDQGGYNCASGSDIWNNSQPDPAVLVDPTGSEVHRYPS